MLEQTIITFPLVPPQRLADHFESIRHDDPIRSILHKVRNLEDAIHNIREEDFPDYGFFLSTIHVQTGRRFPDSNFFFEKARRFTIRDGVMLEPCPPICVYRRIHDMESTIQRTLVPHHTKWVVENICPSILKNRTEVIELVAGGEVAIVNVHPAIRDAILPSDEKIVPLLVLTTPHDSIAFAKFVMDLLHCTREDSIRLTLRQNKHLLDNLSVDLRKKFYDIFPEEYVCMPRHIWHTFRILDKYEMSDGDVADLSQLFKHSP